jgi:hypothetical protein
MEPEIAAAGLPQADPFVLAMVAAHLQAQPPGTLEFERGRSCTLELPALGSAGAGQLQQGAALLFEGLQMIKRSAAVVLGSLLQVGEAGFELFDPLLVQLEPRGDGGH